VRIAIILIALLDNWLTGATAPVKARPPHKGQVGWASWYGSLHHDKLTAKGKRCSMHHLTAAHRSLPLGTTVAVSHLRTGRQVVVRINDRGPYVDSQRCIIDLSRAAACRLGFEHSGLAPVRVVVKEAPARSMCIAQALRPRRS
jgi:rare lipoprotein A